MGIFKSASDYPRHFDIVLYVVSIWLTASSLNQDLPKHTWSIPSQNDLVFAEGHFSRVKHDIKAPYMFVTEAGPVLELGCLPESAMASCLEDVGINLSSLSRETSRVGYFYVENSSSLDLSNVMMTLSAGNSPIFTYEAGKEKLERWSETEERIKHSMLTIGADFLLPLPLALLALWLTLSKRKARRQQALA